MKRPITEDEYKLLKIFPRNMKYLKRSRIEKAAKKLFYEDRFYEVVQALHNIDYLNGDFDGVGLRITPEGKLASKTYKDSRPLWATRHPFAFAIIVAAIAALISGGVSVLIELQKNQSQYQLDSRQDSAIKAINDTVTNLQEHIKDSAK